MFCKFCGANIDDNSRFCAQCGSKLDSDNQRSSAPQTYRVTIFRESQFYVINPPVNILIDEKIRRSIENGGTLELDMEPGRHIFEFSQSLRKRTLQINVDHNIGITVKWNRFTGALIAQQDY